MRASRPFRSALFRPRCVLASVLLSGLLGCAIGSGIGMHRGGGRGGSGGGNGGGNGPTGPSGPVGPVAPFFFGMHVNRPNSPFPPSAGVPVAGVRLWDTHTSWATTNTGPGRFDWSELDSRVNEAVGYDADVLYDLARTPGWAQCAENNTSCGSGNANFLCGYADLSGEGGPGECFPPSDLRVDGSGTNQHWIDWVTAVANRYKGKISYYEIWNEPNNSVMWQGTNAQLVRMAGDARCIIEGDKGCNPQSSYTQKGIDPAAQMLTPAYTNPVADAAAYLTTPLNGGTGTGSTFADAIAFHGYPGEKPAEDVLKIYGNLYAILNGQGLQGMPVFNTEGSWGTNNNVSELSDPDQEAAFTARYLLVQQSAGIQRLYWYGWDLGSGNGTLWTNAGLTRAGVSYQQTESWLMGATLSAPCSASGSVWSCNYTRSGGYQAMVVWNASQSCSGGNCSTSNYPLPAATQFTQYQDVLGTTHAISGGSVPIGAKPILIETGNIP
jgi:hypothetical protein